MYLTTQLQDNEAKTDRAESKNKSIITAEDCNTPFSIIDRTSRQNTVNNIKDLNSTKNLT